MHVLRADETFPLAGFEAQVRRERPCGRIGSRLEWNLPHPVAHFLAPAYHGPDSDLGLYGALPVSRSHSGYLRVTG